MQKPLKMKQAVIVLLPIIFLLGVVFAIPRGNVLKADDSDQPFAYVKIEGETVSLTDVVRTEDEVQVELTGKDNHWVKLPDSQDYELSQPVSEGVESQVQEITVTDIDGIMNPIDTEATSEKQATEETTKEKTAAEQDVKDVEGTADTASEETAKATQETAVSEPSAQDVPAFYHVTEQGKGTTYIYLVKDQTVSLHLKRLTETDSQVVLVDAENSKAQQPLFSFEQKEQEATSESTQASSAVEESTQETQNSTSNTSAPVEEDEKDPQGVSTTNPFKVDVDVGRTTGIAPFDTEKAAGYDTSADDDIVRTWDQVNYRVMLGISNIDEKYASLKIRLDSEVDDAWRNDSSGQSRQTAEIALGTLTDSGNGTKKSTRSTWETLDKAAGQVYFTETVSTYGGVNEDLINPKFKVTIESATLKDGSTEQIDQVIDDSVVPYLSDEVYLSAKPLVDVKLAWTPRRMTTFEKATGTKDHPYSMITNVGAYAQLRPLPGRDDSTSIKGSTYPVGGIEYKIEQQMNYTNEQTGESKELVIGVDSDPIQTIIYDGLHGWNMQDDKKATPEFAQYKDNYQAVTRQGLDAPVGYTKRTYPPDQPYSTSIGIYDTGNPIVSNESDFSMKVTNNDYTPTSVGKNKWLLSGTKMPSDAEPFSVVAMQVLFPYDYIEQNKGSIDYKLHVAEVTYEGTTQDVDSSLDMVWDKKWPGGIKNYTAALSADEQGLSTNPPDSKNYSSAGNSITTQENKIYGSFMTSFTDVDADQSTMYARWNEHSMKYDPSRKVVDRSTGSKLSKTYYGVGDSLPKVSLRKMTDLETAYTWYEDAGEAQKNGNITAIKAIYNVSDSAGSANARILVPLIASGDVGSTDDKTNPNILLTNTFNLESDGKTISKSYPTDKIVDYRATTYDEKGVVNVIGSPVSDWGDTLYIAGMTIRPTIKTNQTTYSPGEKINWSVEGKVESGAENNHKVQFAVSLPKETRFVTGTAKDYEGKAVADPVTTENPDGSYVLTWLLDYDANGSTYNPKISFDTTIISSELTFVNNVASLEGKVVADVWLEEDENVCDSSSDNVRTSKTGVTITNSGVIVVDKVVDKPFIESGNEIDPANPLVQHPTDFTYKISFKNHSAAPMKSVRVLDVLPYNGDERGTAYKGTYSVTDASTINGAATLYYSNNSVPADTDPNSIVLSSGWYKLGSDMSVLKKAKAIVAVYDAIDPGEDLSFSLTMRPDGQQAADRYVNAPSLNSSINKFVQGVPCNVTVYGRDISGVAWYDDQKDGLIGTLKSGLPEAYAKDIPVKLYRTSLVDPSYKKKLVKESLTGEAFVDGSDNSVVKTDANGKYFFKNLPEGDYLAEFTVGDLVVQKKVQVTKPNVGDDVTKNSKADQKSYQTPEYNEPPLNELPSKSAEKDLIYHVTDVNIGLIRPSQLRLYKYEAGSAPDANKDGSLSDAEKATGTPLADAEFDIHAGDMGDKLGSGITDATGWLTYEPLFPGKYTLVETKAPSGYELVKEPIPFTIAEGNSQVAIYQEDGKATVLPYAGGSGLAQAFLILSGTLVTIGLFVVYGYYRTPKKKGEH